MVDVAVDNNSHNVDGSSNIISLQECQSKMNISLNKVQFALSSHAASNVYMAVMESAEVLLAMSTYLNSAGSAVKAAAISQQLARMLKTAASHLKEKKHKTSSRRNSMSLISNRHGTSNLSENTVSSNHNNDNDDDVNGPLTQSNTHSRSSSIRYHDHDEHDSVDNNVSNNNNNNNNRNNNNEEHNKRVNESRLPANSSSSSNTNVFELDKSNYNNNSKSNTNIHNGPPIALDETLATTNTALPTQTTLSHVETHLSDITQNKNLQNELHSLREHVFQLENEKEELQASHDELEEYIHTLEEKCKTYESDAKNNQTSNDLYSELHELEDALEEEQMKSHALNDSLREAEELIAHDDLEISQLREELKKQRQEATSREAEITKLTLELNNIRRHVHTLESNKTNVYTSNDTDSHDKSNKVQLEHNDVDAAKHNTQTQEEKEPPDSLSPSLSNNAHGTEEYIEHEEEIAALKATIREQHARENDLLSQIKTLQANHPKERETAPVATATSPSTSVIDNSKENNNELQALRDANKLLHSQLQELEQHNMQLESELEDLRDETEATRETAVVYAKKVKVCTLEVENLNKELERVERSFASSQEQQGQQEEVTKLLEQERTKYNEEIALWQQEAKEQTARADACESTMRHQANELEERLLHLTHTLEEERAKYDAQIALLQEQVKEQELQHTNISQCRSTEQTENQNVIRSLRTQNKVLQVKIAATEEEVNRLSRALEQAEADLEFVEQAHNTTTGIAHQESEPLTRINSSENKNKWEEKYKELQHQYTQIEAEKEMLNEELSRLAKHNDEYALLTTKYNTILNDNGNLHNQLQLIQQRYDDSVIRIEELEQQIKNANKETATIKAELVTERENGTHDKDALLTELNKLKAVCETDKVVIDNLEHTSKELNTILSEKDELIARLTEQINTYKNNTNTNLNSSNTNLVSSSKKNERLDDYETLSSCNVYELLECNAHNIDHLRNAVNAKLWELEERIKEETSNATSNSDTVLANGSNLLKKLHYRFAIELQLHKLREEIKNTVSALEEMLIRLSQEMQHVQHTSEYLHFVLQKVYKTINKEITSKNIPDSAV